MHTRLILALALMFGAAMTALAACPPGGQLTSLGRTTEGPPQTGWRITNNTGATTTFTLAAQDGSFTQNVTLNQGEQAVIASTFATGAAVHFLNGACGTFQTKAAGYQPWVPPQPPAPGPNNQSLVSQATIAAYLAHTYSISERNVSGLFARDRIERAKRAAAGEPVRLAAGTDAMIRIGEDEPKEAPPWNAWVDARYTSVQDGRYDLDTRGHLSTGTLGIDRQFGDRTIVGFAIAGENLNFTGYNESTHVRANGAVAGPYAAYQIRPNLVIDGWLAYGVLPYDVSIAGTAGSYDVRRALASLNLTGQYEVGAGVRFRPKFSIFYSRDWAGSYTDSSGGVNGSSKYGFGAMAASGEVNRIYRVSDDALLMPYVQLGVRYDYKRPLNGEVFTNAGTVVTPSALSGYTNLGLRSLLYNSVVLETTVGYLSMFQPGLNVYTGRVALSVFF